MRIEQGDVLDNRIHLIPILKNITILALQYKINLYDMAIILFGKMTN